jgi:hypothetical protein
MITARAITCPTDNGLGASRVSMTPQSSVLTAHLHSDRGRWSGAGFDSLDQLTERLGPGAASNLVSDSDRNRDGQANR